MRLSKNASCQLMQAACGRLSSPTHAATWHNGSYVYGHATPVKDANFVAVATWLMAHLSDAQKAGVWAELCQTERSLLAVEMKAHRPEQHAQEIKWSEAGHSFAAAHVRLPALRWLLKLQVLAPKYTHVHKDGKNGRALLLVHGHCWRLPAQLQGLLEAAEMWYVTYYAIAKQHQREAFGAACLGSLPPDIFGSIACEANLDFRWRTLTR